MTRYHMNLTTRNPVTCVKKSCGEQHFESKAECKKLLDEKLYQRLSGQLPTELFSKLQEPLRSEYPEEVLQVCTAFLQEEGLEVLAVVPSGSLLYNTRLPGKPLHDYDLVIFTRDESAKNYRHLSIQELDLFIIPLHLVPTYTRSAQVMEAWLAWREGRVLYSAELATLEGEAEVLAAHQARLKEQVEKYEAGGYSEYEIRRRLKHLLRWKRYMARPAGELSPVLSQEEREAWLQELALAS